MRYIPLRNISDSDLLTRLEKTRGAERAAQHAIVLYLAEVERRKLYLPRGYGSLFEFCTEYLKYSRSSAGRRIGAARCIARYPRMAALFRRGECDLTVLSLVAGIVTKENCAEIAVWLKGRSLREVEAYVARRHPARGIRDRVRQIYVMSTKPALRVRNYATPTAPAPGNGTTTPAATPVNGKAPVSAALREGDEPQAAVADTGGAECKASLTFTPSAGSKTMQLVDNDIDKNRTFPTSVSCWNESSTAGGENCARSGSEEDLNFMQTDTGSFGSALAERVVVERKYKLQFAVNPNFMDKYNKVKSLLSSRYPTEITFEMLFDTVMDEYLKNHSPENRIKRRNERKKRSSGRTKGSAPQKSRVKVDPDDTGKRRITGKARCGQVGIAAYGTSKVKKDGKKRRAERSRHIPQEIRDEVFVRAGGRCAFIGDDGKRCDSTWNLEIDHIIPFAKGGGNTPDNLRLLCAKHNKLAAEQEFGRERMNKYNRRE